MKTGDGEYEGRPPYLHVGVPFEITQHWGRSLLTLFVGYDSGWVWREHGRHVDALTRYSQDAAARRSAHSVQVHVVGVFVLHDMAAGGDQERVVWRVDSCVDGVVSRNGNILWDVRVE
jgi:hypothetical protein